MTALAPSLTRPAYRPYRAWVRDVQRLSPHFARITFASDDFRHFGTAGLDQRIKVLIPFLDGSLCDVGQDDEGMLLAGTWYDAWRALPEERRNPFRTYTVRRIDNDACVLTVDFVLHHDPGPAGAWAESARAGDEIVIVGPDERSPHSRTGIDWQPGSASRLLLAGDETALPAIGGILDALPADRFADVFIEIPTADDARVLTAPPHADVRWVVRQGGGGRAREHGAGLIDAVTEWAAANGDTLSRAAAPRPQELADVDVDRELLWDSPAALGAPSADGEFYAWIAGEAATVKLLRRLLVSGHGVDRRRVAFMGYWRRGLAERTG
ncbi:siderophore-interacting protein [Microbacterium album]|uniref:FAD-binding FR-type domain-containing protein n=1 Tax=Microbacterium album TaxID=2053191 RepID=A0A917ICH4_9MICO|nr:siderophore-interacting protein [Microbacterium album]GGH34831.1 hypothetical protein GCM10010921_02850 [Microbacterium album]